MPDFINTIYQFIKPFLENKIFNFQEYRVFKGDIHPIYIKLYILSVAFKRQQKSASEKAT